jgi:PPK2 family polyphosphate:nucleotide phosphotransferase
MAETTTSAGEAGSDTAGSELARSGLAPSDTAESAGAPGLRDLLRLPQGPVDLGSFDARATPGAPGGKSETKAASGDLVPEVSDLQERLFAAGQTRKDAPRVLVILQGMDTSGKGGVIRHAIGMVDPQGVRIKAFKAPTEAERAHHFLWRIGRELPPPGIIGIFDRSHYEDVLIVRVHHLVEEALFDQRYAEITEWEASLAASGCTLVKCFLHISSEKQKERLGERLADPTKYWKYSTGDIDERRKWPEYQRAYEIALERCNTAQAPWYVIPSDRKWYRNWAVAQLLTEHLRALDLGWPPADFDVEQERRRLAES